MPMLRFTIRDALWLMAVLGLVTGWLVDHRKQAIQSKRDQWNFRMLSKDFEIRTKGKVRVDGQGIWMDMPSGTTAGYDRELNPDP